MHNMFKIDGQRCILRSSDVRVELTRTGERQITCGTLTMISREGSWRCWSNGFHMLRTPERLSIGTTDKQGALHGFGVEEVIEEGQLVHIKGHWVHGKEEGEIARVAVDDDGIEAFLLGGRFAEGRLLCALGEETVMRRLASLEQTHFQMELMLTDQMEECLERVMALRAVALDECGQDVDRRMWINLCVPRGQTGFEEGSKGVIMTQEEVDVIKAAFSRPKERPGSGQIGASENEQFQTAKRARRPTTRYNIRLIDDAVTPGDTVNGFVELTIPRKNVVESVTVAFVGRVISGDKAVRRVFRVRKTLTEKGLGAGEHALAFSFSTRRDLPGSGPCGVAGRARTLQRERTSSLDALSVATKVGGTQTIKRGLDKVADALRKTREKQNGGADMVYSVDVMLHFEKHAPIGLRRKVTMREPTLSQTLLQRFSASQLRRMKAALVTELDKEVQQVQYAFDREIDVVLEALMVTEILIGTANERVQLEQAKDELQRRGAA